MACYRLGGISIKSCLLYFISDWPRKKVAAIILVQLFIEVQTLHESNAFIDHTLKPCSILKSNYLNRYLFFKSGT